MQQGKPPHMGEGNRGQFSQVKKSGPLHLIYICFLRFKSPGFNLCLLSRDRILAHSRCMVLVPRVGLRNHLNFIVVDHQMSDI